MTPRVMRAAFVQKPGPATAIEIGELQVPCLGPGDLLLTSKFVAVNHVDTFVRAGLYPSQLPKPFIVGRDVVGVVAAVGSNVTEYAPGAWVWTNSLGYEGRQGPSAEYCVVAADRARTLPPDADPAATAALLHPLTTAYLGLVEKAAVSFYDRVFIGHAASAVGTAAVQLAKLLGAEVITSSRAKDLDWCRSIGADYALDVEDPAWFAQLEAWASSASRSGISIFWDTSGDFDYDEILRVLKKGAKVMVTAGIDRHSLFPQGKYYTRDVSVVGFAVSNAGTAELSRVTDGVDAVLRHGIPAIRIDTVAGLDDLPEAHRRLEGAPGTRPPAGRILIDLSKHPHRQAPLSV